MKSNDEFAFLRETLEIRRGMLHETTLVSRVALTDPMCTGISTALLLGKIFPTPNLKLFVEGLEITDFLSSLERDSR